MIIERPELVKRINELNKWLLVYGRRKTGKTFLLTKFVKHDEYFFIKRDKEVITGKGEELSYDSFKELLKRDIKEEKTVIIDEFHRLGDEFLDFLQYTEKKGKVILVSSTLCMSKKMLSTHSPLLGFLAEVPVTIISLKDVIKALRNFRVSKKELLELAVIMREPLAIDYFKDGTKTNEISYTILVSTIKTIPALTGEVFLEESRSISNVYEGVLRAVANGNEISSEISSQLYARRLINKDDPSMIQQYLNNLQEFGLIKRVPVYGTKKYVYKHTSPLAKIFYYADEKYNISERSITEQEAKTIITELMPKIMEDNIRELLAEHYSLRESVINKPKLEIDACLLKLNKPEIIAEIKWKTRIDKEDVMNAEANLEQVKAKKKILFVPDKTGVKTKLDLMDYTDLV